MPFLVIFVFLYLYFVLDLYIVLTHVFSGYANLSRGKEFSRPFPSFKFSCENEFYSLLASL